MEKLCVRGEPLYVCVRVRVCLCVCFYIYVCMCWRINIHYIMYPYTQASFPAKSPVISGSFVKIDCNLTLLMHLRHPVSRIHTRRQRYRMVRTHETLYLYRSFSSKEPYDWWLFCEKRPAT